MTLAFISRIRKELSLTGQALYETILAISERVNRKVQILQLHWQSTTLTHRLEDVYRSVGTQVCQVLSAAPPAASHRSPPALNSLDFSRRLSVAAESAAHLKQTILQVDSLIRELKLEAVHDNLVKFQQDLAVRSAAFERVVVAQGAPAIGRTLADLHLPMTTRIITVFRGPFLVPPAESLVFRADDVVVMLGLQEDITRLLPSFHTHRSKHTA